MPKGQIPWNKQFVTSTCCICGKVFPVSPSYLKQGRYKCCSLECRGKHRSKFIRFVYPNLEPSQQLSYVIGVLIGDGCVSKYNGKYNIILNVTDETFALSFKRALRELGLHPWLNSAIPRNKSRKYFRVTAMSKTFGEWLNALTKEQISLAAHKYPTDFLKGFYESEGTASQHRVCIVNTDVWKLEIAKLLIESLNFKTSLYSYSRLLPAKTAYELHILGGRSEQSKFLSLIEPCIKRGRHENSLSYRL